MFCGRGYKLLLLLRGIQGFIPFSHINHLVVLRGHKVYVVKVKMINDIKI